MSRPMHPRLLRGAYLVMLTFAAVSAYAGSTEPQQPASQHPAPQLPESRKSGGDDARIASISVVGTAFQVTLASGRVLSNQELTGATLTLVVPGGSTPEEVRIDAVVNDPLDPTGETLIYKMRALDPESGEWVEMCNPDAAGERWAFPMRGQWDSEGYVLSDAGFTLTCGDGSMGKCVRWGYKPWKTLPDGRSLADYHQACVRMVNANYCGDRRTTRDGMLIDYWDDLGIAQPDPDTLHQGLAFEAAWGPNGAICVAHTRVPEHETLDGLSRDCPRLAGRLGPEVCTPSTLERWKEHALLFNRSR
ncbi:MAG: ADYC domain-containing protein [Acidobacteriota bacterium]